MFEAQSISLYELLMYHYFPGRTLGSSRAYGHAKLQMEAGLVECATLQTVNSGKNNLELPNIPQKTRPRRGTFITAKNANFLLAGRHFRHF